MIQRIFGYFDSKGSVQIKLGSRTGALIATGYIRKRTGALKINT